MLKRIAFALTLLSVLPVHAKPSACALALEGGPEVADDPTSFRQRERARDAALDWLKKIDRGSYARLGADDRANACANLTHTVIAHHLVPETSKVVAVFERVCGGTPGARAAMVEITKDLLGTTVERFGTQAYLAADANALALKMRTHVATWLKHVADADLGRETWLELLHPAPAALVVGLALNGDWAKTRLTSEDVHQAVGRAVASVPDARWTTFVDAAGARDPQAAEPFLDKVGLPLLIDQRHAADRIDAELVERARERVRLAPPEYLEAWRTTEAIQKLIADPSVDLDVILELTRAIFGGDWNRGEFAGVRVNVAWFDGPPQAEERQIRLGLRDHALFGRPEAEGLARQSASLRRQWLEAALSRGSSQIPEVIRTKMFKDLPLDLVARTLTFTAEQQRPRAREPLGRLGRLAARLLPARMRESKHEFWRRDRTWARWAAILPPDLRAPVVKSIRNADLMEAFLRAAKPSKRERLQLVYDFVRRSEATEFSDRATDTLRLSRVIKLNRPARLELTRFLLRQYPPTSYEMYDVRSFARAMRLKEQEAIDATLAEALFGALNARSLRGEMFIDPTGPMRNAVGPESPFADVFARLKRLAGEEDGVLTQGQLKTLARVATDVPTLQGYVRAWHSPGRPMPAEGQSDVSYLASVMGLAPEAFDRITLTPERTRRLQTLAFGLDAAFGARPLASLRFAPGLITTDTFESVVGLFERVLAAMNAAQSREFVFDRGLKDFDALVRGRVIDSAVIHEWASDLAARETAG